MLAKEALESGKAVPSHDNRSVVSRLGGTVEILGNCLPVERLVELNQPCRNIDSPAGENLLEALEKILVSFDCLLLHLLVGVGAFRGHLAFNGWIVGTSPFEHPGR